MSSSLGETGLMEGRLSDSARRGAPASGLIRFSVKALLFIIVSIVAVFMIAPFAWMVITSIKPKAEIFTLKIIWWPSRVTFDSYRDVFTAAPFLRYMLNSLIISSTDVASSLLFSTMTGYAFAKFRVRGANLIFMVILSGLMIPFSVRLIPLYLAMVNAGLSDTYFGVIAPNLLSIMGIFLLRQYATTLPDELIDFARIDGASEPRIFFMIIMPLCKPAMAALGIFKFMFTFNDFLWPLVMINDVTKRTITVGLAMFSGYYTTYYGQFMAASTFAVIPIILVYMFFQRQIIQGIALTGLKG
jgi:multiple sugar transport system permease protein